MRMRRHMLEESTYPRDMSNSGGIIDMLERTARIVKESERKRTES